MWSFVKIKTLCNCINSENNLQFTISISSKLWNNSMGFQCWPTHKIIAKKAIRFISNAKYNSHTSLTKALATRAWRRHEQQWLTSSGNCRGRCWKPPSMLSPTVLNLCGGRHSIAGEGLHVVSTIPLPSC